MEVYDMDMIQICILVGIGILAGGLSGVFGIGGGIIIIPLLVMMLGFSQKMAQGTTLVMLLPPIGILAVINYYKIGQIKLNAALLLAIGFMVGSYVGSYYIEKIPDLLLKRLFAAYLLVVSVRMLFAK